MHGGVQVFFSCSSFTLAYIIKIQVCCLSGVLKLDSEPFFIRTKTLTITSDSPLSPSPRPGRCHGTCSWLPLWTRKWTTSVVVLVVQETTVDIEVSNTGRVDTTATTSVVTATWSVIKKNIKCSMTRTLRINLNVKTGLCDSSRCGDCDRQSFCYMIFFRPYTDVRELDRCHFYRRNTSHGYFCQLQKPIRLEREGVHLIANPLSN